MFKLNSLGQNLFFQIAIWTVFSAMLHGLLISTTLDKVALVSIVSGVIFGGAYWAMTTEPNMEKRKREPTDQIDGIGYGLLAWIMATAALVAATDPNMSLANILVCAAMVGFLVIGGCLLMHYRMERGRSQQRNKFRVHAAKTLKQVIERELRVFGISGVRRLVQEAYISIFDEMIRRDGYWSQSARSYAHGVIVTTDKLLNQQSPGALGDLTAYRGYLIALSDENFDVHEIQERLEKFAR